MTPEHKEIIKYGVDVLVVVAAALFANKEVKYYAKNILRKLRPHHSIIKSEIQITLDMLRVRVGAVRCGIWMLSNGQNALNGYSYKYANMVYESVGVGHSPVKEDVKKIPVESFAEVLMAVQKSDWIFIGTPNSPYPILNAVYKHYGYSCAVESKFVNSNVDMGFISVSFANQAEPTAEQLSDIKETTALIYSLIKKLD